VRPIEVRDLTKVYETAKRQPGLAGAVRSLFSREKTRIEAVKGISFDVEAGEIVGFLGPNGAGKTTTLKMLSGILYPTSGEATVLGYKPFDRKPAMLRQISLVMGNRQQLWWDLPARESFAVLKELYDVPDAEFKTRLDRLLTDLEITDKVDVQVRKLSLGERMKCELVAALLHAPRVLFLDEPTIGLDVVSQKRIRDFLREFNRDSGCTMLLTSHYMQDVQELCRRVVVIDHGKLVFDGELDELTARHSDTRRLRLTFDGDVPAELGKFGEVTDSNEGVAVLAVPRAKTAEVTAAVLQAFTVIDIAVEDVPVEEVVRGLFASS
jgi:ABC-2 type transport system ATP-binding protein